MQAEEGTRVTIGFICRLEDGTVYDVADRDNLEFVIGQGNTLPSLEMGVIGMHPGEQRTIRVPAAEADEFPFEELEAPTESHPSAGIGLGYDFGPGEDGGDVFLTPPPVRPVHERRRAAGDLIFEVDMISVEEADLKIQE